MYGDLDNNWLLPGALGVTRPTCLVPELMIDGDLRLKDPVVVVGFDHFNDFFPEIAADNLIDYGINAKCIRISIDRITNSKRINSLTLASLFENPDTFEQIAEEFEKQLAKLTNFSPPRAGFPAVLGVRNSPVITKKLRDRLGMKVFEIPTLPYSIPGIRLSQVLVDAIRRHSGQVYDGINAVQAFQRDNRIISVTTEAAARSKNHYAPTFILAAGGFLGGGLIAEIDGVIREPVFNLHVNAPHNQSEWFDRHFLSLHGHPLFSSGIQTDKALHPLSRDGLPEAENLFVVGSMVAGSDPLRDRSHQGIDLLTAYAAAQSIQANR